MWIHDRLLAVIQWLLLGSKSVKVNVGETRVELFKILNLNKLRVKPAEKLQTGSSQAKYKRSKNIKTIQAH